MNENLERLLLGWYPRADAHWAWWLIANIMAMVSMLKHIVLDKLRRK